MMLLKTLRGVFRCHRWRAVRAQIGETQAGTKGDTATANTPMTAFIPVQIGIKYAATCYRKCCHGQWPSRPGKTGTPPSRPQSHQQSSMQPEPGITEGPTIPGLPRPYTHIHSYSLSSAYTDAVTIIHNSHSPFLKGDMLKREKAQLGALGMGQDGQCRAQNPSPQTFS